MSEKKNNQEQVSKFYKDILQNIGGEQMIAKLIEALEKSTGLKVTEPQRQYLENYASSTAMKWARVMQAVNEGAQDPNVMRELKKKIEKG